jgi:hypothetical protein
VRPSIRSLSSGVVSGVFVWITIEWRDNLTVVGAALAVWLVLIFLLWVRVARSHR